MKWLWRVVVPGAIGCVMFWSIEGMRDPMASVIAVAGTLLMFAAVAWSDVYED